MGMLWVMLLKLSFSYGAEIPDAAFSQVRDYDISKERLWAIDTIEEVLELTDNDGESEEFRLIGGSSLFNLKLHQVCFGVNNLDSKLINFGVKGLSPPLYLIFCLFRI